jgi:hypothetical protein
MRLLSSQELLKLSIMPKADLTVKTHFAVKRLGRIVDRIKGSES